MQLLLKNRTGRSYVDPVNVCKAIHQADHQEHKVSGRKKLSGQRGLLSHLRMSNLGVSGCHGFCPPQFYQENGPWAMIFFA
jgi:hypothetical protein